MTKEEIKEFVNECISDGCVRNKSNIMLTNDDILLIEDILYRYNDKTARTKINKIINNIKVKHD